MMKKIIFFDGGIETQSFFSKQLDKALRQMGHETYTFNLRQPLHSAHPFFKFIEKGNTVLINFNYHGMSGEYYFIDQQNGHMIWDDLAIPSYDIVVDHPYYYHTFLCDMPRLYHQISIDRNHIKYLKRFWPEIELGPFLPLAGTRLNPGKPLLPIEKRRYEVAMTGNYTPPSHFEKYITRLDDEYTAFYYGIIDDMLAHPEKTLEDTAEEHIRREIPEVSEAELKSVMPNLIFIDNYIRFTVRGRAVAELADNGIKVNLFGGGWNQLECKHPENLIVGESLISSQCLEMLGDTKVSLNVMPWFKDGAHDRIFNSMLNGAVSLTDSSVYLDSILHSGTDSMIYSLSDMDAIPDMVSSLLSDNDRMQQIADNGYRMAAKDHTWGNRAKVLHDYIESGQM
jgi:hypothetical protein